MKPVPLDVFFLQMAAMLEGRRSASEVEAVLGRSDSGTQRLGLYATLVARQQWAVLDEFYVAAKVAADTPRRGRFAKLREAFLRQHPPSHWSPARAAEHFGQFLESQSVTAELIELVDYAWTRHQVLHARASDPARLAVRHYTHRVRDFSRQVEAEGRASGRPVKEPETCLIGTSRETAALVVLEPSIAALVVLQVLEDRSWSADLPEVPRGLAQQEADHLHALGLLSQAQRLDLTVWLDG